MAVRDCDAADAGLDDARCGRLLAPERRGDDAVSVLLMATPLRAKRRTTPISASTGRGAKTIRSRRRQGLRREEDIAVEERDVLRACAEERILIRSSTRIVHDGSNCDGDDDARRFGRWCMAWDSARSICLPVRLRLSNSVDATSPVVDSRFRGGRNVSRHVAACHGGGGMDHGADGRIRDLSVVSRGAAGGTWRSVAFPQAISQVKSEHDRLALDRHGVERARCLDCADFDHDGGGSFLRYRSSLTNYPQLRSGVLIFVFAVVCERRRLQDSLARN